MIEGQRFSQVYLNQGTQINDSERMRNRISAFHSDLRDDDRHKIVELIHIETGAKVPFMGTYFSLTRFVEKCPIRDLLDAITIIYRYFLAGGQTRRSQAWHAFVTRVFKEENLGYRLDEKGGVHFFIDEEFERNRSTLISLLAQQPSVLSAFEKAYNFLDRDPPDTANSIRAIFEAMEILYKHIINAQGKDRLNSVGVQKKLKPLLQEKYSDSEVVSTATDHLMDGLCDWLDAGHMYRHGQKTDEPQAPPLEYAVLYVSQGASYLRFLLPMA